ncbi:MAG: phosphoribosylaminoimidazolesuccinocarboxamide synthase, partial [Gammaproteobacteria bacterium]
MNDGYHATAITSLPLTYSGKVRDIYAIDEQYWLIVASDRVSAFDVILPTILPGKGRLLTELALFWFRQVEPIIGNHLVDLPLEAVLPDAEERRAVEGRSMVVRRLDAAPYEAVVRGYLSGSGWKDYTATGAICGVSLGEGLKESAQLDAPIFTPATKAAVGDHDENVSFEHMSEALGPDLANRIREVSLALYRHGAEYACQRGLILADTKFEFGLDAAGELRLMDEVLTPDSSRFWEASSWQPGTTPASFDKQY